MGKKKEAYSWDLDDAVIDRKLYTRVAGLVRGVVKPHKKTRQPSILTIPLVERTVVESGIRNPIEQVSFNFHARREVFPHIPDFLERSKADGIDHYGNTGRSNKRPWVDMTYETLGRGGVDGHFTDVFFTPDQMKTAVSKAAGILYLKEQYEHVSHFEDDPRTAVYLALMFPDVQIYLIHYGTTGLLYSQGEVDSISNIQRIAFVRDPDVRIQHLQPDRSILK